MNDKIIIRQAHSADAEAVQRLAQLDSTKVPEGDLIVALVGDDIRAAVAREGGQSIADPFHYTEELVDAMKSFSTSESPRLRMRRRPVLSALRLA